MSYHVHTLSWTSIHWTLITEVCATRLISFQSHRVERPVWTPVLVQATAKARAAHGTVVSMKDFVAKRAIHA